MSIVDYEADIFDYDEEILKMLEKDEEVKV